MRGIEPWPDEDLELVEVEEDMQTTNEDLNVIILLGNRVKELHKESDEWFRSYACYYQGVTYVWPTLSDEQKELFKKGHNEIFNALDE